MIKTVSALSYNILPLKISNLLLIFYLFEPIDWFVNFKRNLMGKKRDSKKNLKTYKTTPMFTQHK